MRQKQRIAFLCLTLLCGLVLGAVCVVSSQEYTANMPEQTNQGHKSMQHQTIETQRQADQVRKTAASAPTLSAMLIQAEQKAKQHEAGVQVQVAGIDIVDPAMSSEKPQPGQGHLHYQVDSGPVIATTATKLNFHKACTGEAPDYCHVSW